MVFVVFGNTFLLTMLRLLVNFTSEQITGFNFYSKIIHNNLA